MKTSRSILSGTRSIRNYIGVRSQSQMNLCLYVMCVYDRCDILEKKLYRYSTNNVYPVILTFSVTVLSFIYRTTAGAIHGLAVVFLYVCLSVCQTRAL